MWHRIAQLFRASPAVRTPSGPVAPDEGSLSRRVLTILFHPIIEAEGGRRLTNILGWAHPDDLADQYAADLRLASGGFADFRVVERIEVDHWPRKIDGFQYDDRSYLRTWRQQQGFHDPDSVDYPAILAQWNILERIERDEIDEVWLFGGPNFGFWESTMAGQSAFWCNSSPIASTGHCNRRFVVMGFNYERGVDCMLENFGHRTESIMEEVYRRAVGLPNQWAAFTRYDAQMPGRAACGNVHFAPSSLHDYDWGNPRPVVSNCDDWLNYPQLQGTRRLVQCQDWGSGDMRLHHLWWLRHLPRAAGRHDGVLNNWWRYVLDPNLV